LPAVAPERLQQQYGLVGAYTDEVPTSDGALRGTLVPVTLTKSEPLAVK